jgi:ribosomal protein S18 acetylase RimI-like enzyme
MTTDLRLHEIASDADAAWEGWRRIYSESFPPTERMSEQWLLGKPGRRLLALQDAATGAVLGIACCEAYPENGIAVLWYLAIAREHRNQRLGRVLYKEARRLYAESGVKALAIEVEIPGGPDDEGWAARRIDWYRRRGAFLLEGVETTVQVDTGAPPTRMWLMLHAYQRLDPQQCYALAKALFPDTLEQTGDLRLT